MYARVIVDVAHSEVDKTFEYSCGSEAKLGCRVKVPFGGRVIDGFIVGISATTQFPPEKIKPIISVFDEPPALVDECFTLMQSISERYRVPKAVALRLFLPTEMRTGRVRGIT